ISFRHGITSIQIQHNYVTPILLLIQFHQQTILYLAIKELHIKKPNRISSDWAGITLDILGVYLTGPGSGFYVEKRSLFIAFLCPFKDNRGDLLII
ncbi:MAG: hypothetical protein J5941_06200, partial [Solobacterium sp.]|nr:hypothetical protein [Solobacterium sp.]